MRKGRSLDSGIEGKLCLFFDGAVHLSQVLAKGVGRISRTPLQILREMQLALERVASFDRVGLLPLSLPNRARCCQQVFSRCHRNKDAAIIIRENDIVRGDFEFTEARGAQR